MPGSTPFRNPMDWIDPYRLGTPLAKLHHCITTIGVFDGIHLGHRAILDQTLTWAHTEGRPAVVLTFGVHPDQIVKGVAPPLLQSLELRRRHLERLGFDAALVLRFDEELRQTSAEDFAQKILRESLRARGVVLGHDTAVGKDRRGNVELLTRLGLEGGFEVQHVGEIAIDGEVVSSTKIRAAYETGDLARAARLLGRPPSLLGRVVRGSGRGRKLGFATANLDLEGALHPTQGVYAVLGITAAGPREGLCNIGRRPTFGDHDAVTVEVHLLDETEDLYDTLLEVVFLERLRSERTFSSPQELMEAIRSDRAAAEPIFRRLRDHRTDA